MALRKTQGKPKKRLVLIDGHAIIHRAYHALPVLNAPGGQQVNAVYGFVSMLLKVVDDLKPTHMAVAFDLPVPTFRHEEYIAYQAQRPEADQELKDQVELVKETVKAAGIPAYTAEGFEADDVIGTLARQAVQSKRVKEWKSRRVNEVVIVTGDRDMLQLVNRKVKVYAPIRGLSEAQLFDEKEVKDYLGIKPAQIVDYKALTGDPSDNYPGVPGVGPKTASSLLQEYGSLEEIYKAVAKVIKRSSDQATKKQKIAEKLVEKLREGYESARLSQKLARIVTSAPVELSLKKTEFHGFAGNEKFLAKLQEFGFRSLVKRLQPNGGDGEKGNGQMELV